MRKIVYSLIALLIAGTMAAQNVQISGIVTDADDGEPMIGVSVAVRGTTIGTATDLEGRYNISVPSNSSLTFTFVGYVEQTVPVSGKKVINVAMESDARSIDEVIVVAYGTATKSAFTGSAAVVKSDAIEAHISTSATKALAGTTPGVQFISSNGDPASGGSQTIRIRGYGSDIASSAPLYIVDGMPYDGSISDINPNDVESMSVLKDASARAIYGARGANGVILITTKKAGGNVPNVKFDAKWGSNSRLIPNYDVITDPGQYYETYFKLLYNKQFYAGKSEAEAYSIACNQLYDANNGGLGYRIFSLPAGQQLIGTNLKLNPAATMGYSDGEYYYQADDWYNETFHNSFRQEYNLSFSGSADKLSYYASIGYLDDGGVVNHSSYQRYSGRINVEYKPKDWMKFTSNIGYSHTSSEAPEYGGSYGSSANLFYITQTMGPIYPLYVRDANGNIMYENGRIQYDANQTNFRRPGTVGNAVRDNEFNRSRTYADVLNANAGITLTPVKGLSLSANLGVFNDNTRSNYLYSQYASSSSTDGAGSTSHSRAFDITSQLLANYKVEFGKNSIDALLGYERYNVTSQGLSAYNDHLFDPFNGELGNAHGKASMDASSSTTGYLTQGIIARLQYEFDERFFLSGSYRRDASTRFADGHRWGNYGSIGGAWLMSKEKFMSGVSWVDMLKLKASYGVQGNDNLNNLGTYFPYADQYGVTYNEETGEYSMSLIYKGNEDITWETSHSFNAGFEFGLFNGYLNGSVEYYNRKTNGLLYLKDVPLSSGNPTGYYPVNSGSLRNSGVELALDGIILHNKKVDWSWNLNLSHNKNTILSLDEAIPEDGEKGSYRIKKVGGSLNEAYLLQYAGLSEEGEALYYMDEKDKDGNVTAKVTTLDPTKATKYDCGTVDPVIFGGFGTSASFHGFDVSVQFAYQLGGKYYDGAYQSLMHTQSSPGQAMHKDLLNSWTPDNTDTDIPRMDGNVLLAQSACDRFLVSSDYLTLNNAQIGYTFPSRIAKKMRLGSLRLYVAGENLFMLSARKGLDPRYGTGLGSMTYASGLNNGSYSAMRNVTGGVTVTF